MARYAACRLCNLATDTFVNIFNEDGISRELGAKMASCLQILVSSEDALPKTVCLTCCNKLNDFYEFYTKSHEVQDLLKEIYASRKYVKKKHLKSADENEKVTKALQNMNQDNNSPCNIAEVVKDEIKYNKGLKDINSALDKNTVCPSVVNVNKKEHVELEIKKFKSSSGMKTESESDEEDDLHPSSSLQNKKHRRKKNPNLNDIPVNPRQIGILDGYPWTCTMCIDLVVDNVQELCKHYKSQHCQSAIFKCVHCEKQYNRYRSFVRHFKQHRDPRKYTCDICSKSFTRKTILRSHATVHSNDRPHVCTVCGKSFKNYNSLTVHNKMHLPDKDKEKFPCRICQKEFSTRHTLEIHLKVHTGERNFMCDICGKSFIVKGSLVYHLLSHTGDRSHVCQTCGKTFKTARLLNKHLTLHSVTQLHKCEVCEKQFRERGRLREHSRIHTGAMPYRCEYCGKCFRFAGILTVHRRQHTGERPYNCEKCNRSFTNWANYNKHMKRIHHYDTSNPENSRRRAELHALSVSNKAAKDDTPKDAASETNLDVN